MTLYIINNKNARNAVIIKERYLDIINIKVTVGTKLCMVVKINFQKTKATTNKQNIDLIESTALLVMVMMGKITLRDF